MQRAKGTDRILDILDFFEGASEPINRNIIATSIGCPKSTLYVLIEDLIRRGWLVQSFDGNISLGSKSARLGLAYARQAKFEVTAREILTNLTREIGEVIELNIVDRWKQLVVMSATHKEHNYLRALEGTMFPLPQTASGRVLLSKIPPDIVQKSIPPEDYIIGSGEILSTDTFLQEIKDATLQGYSIGYKLIDDYISTISVPVINRHGEPIAALSVIMPSTHLESSKAHFLLELQKSASYLSDLLKLTQWDLAQTAYDRLKAL